MLNENAKLWVEALRSGEYEQSFRAMEENGKYCCLAVACKVAEKAGLAIKKDKFGIAGIDLHVHKNVQDWLKIKTTDGKYGFENRNSLLNDNDIHNKTFPEIADIIEANAETLFEQE